MNTFRFPAQTPTLVLPSVAIDAQRSDPPDVPNPLSRLGNILRRRWLLLLCCATLALLLGGIVGMALPPAYTARAQILVSPAAIAANAAAPARSEETAMTVETEVSAIGSRDQLGRVLDRLAATPGFPLDGFGREGKLRRAARWMAAEVEQVFGRSWIEAVLSPEQAAALHAFAEPLHPQRQRERALDEIDANLKVAAEPRARVISVRYTAPSAELAALIANTVADAYIREQEERKRDGIRRDLARLDRQLPELHNALETASAEVRAYRLDQTILDPTSIEQQEQQAFVLKSKIAAAQAALKAAEAERAKSANATRLADESSILTERIQAFQRQLDTLQATLRVTQPAADRLRHLQRLAEAKRQVYEDSVVLRQRLLRDQDLVAPDAAVLSAAAAPQKPASADPILFLPPALVIGLMVGGFAALWRESQDTALRDERAVSAELGIPCIGFMPPASGRAAQRRRMPDLHAAALRGVFAATMQREAVGRPQRVVLITSSVSGEESRWLADSFSRYAARLLPRVLLIRLDMRDSTGRSPLAALSSALRTRWSAAASSRTESPVPGTVLSRPVADLPLDVISVCGRNQDPLAFLVGRDLPQHLKKLREDYDCIVIHAGPILETIEAQLMAGAADRVLFAIRWGHTRRDLADNALAVLCRSGAASVKPGNLLAVLTKVNVRRHRAYRFGDAIEAMIRAHHRGTLA